MSSPRWFRIGLGYLALVSLQIGVWALLAPRSFYDDYPGLGRVWIAVDGPYNEHLVRDVGALNLALATVIVVAAVSLSKPLIVAAAAATLVWGLPHLAYHLVSTEGLAGSDVVASIGGLLVFAVVPVALLATVRGLTDDTGTKDIPAAS